MRGLVRTGGGGEAKSTELFTPSTYDADLTMTATGVALALAAGTTKCHVVNQGVTTEAIRVVFGTSSADALVNLTIVTNAATTGIYLPSNVDAPGSGTMVIGVPSNATHIAAGPAVAADTQDVSITQGV